MGSKNASPPAVLGSPAHWSAINHRRQWRVIRTLTNSDCGMVTCQIEVNSLNGDLVSCSTIVPLELISLLNLEHDFGNLR